MKVSKKLLYFLTLTLLLLTGCQKETQINNVDDNSKPVETTLADDNSKNDLSSQDSKKKDAGLIITAQSDYNELAFSFKELYEKADVVLEINVKSIHTFVEDETGRIISEVSPEIIEVYKGNYTDKKIQILGGRMNYGDYISHPVVKASLEGREDPNVDNEQMKNEDVVYIVDEGYIYEIGDKYFFFGKEYEDENFIRPIYAYQSSFKLENGEVRNEALKNDEPLFLDVNNIFSKNSNLNARTFNISEDIEPIEENSFKEKLNELKKN